MAAATQPFPDFNPAPITLEEYLHSSYHPDCDFVDGYLEERNMGEVGHSLIQVELGFWFRLHKDEWGIRVMSELRTRVGATRVRIPDISVAFNDAAMRESVRVPPCFLPSKSSLRKTASPASSTALTTSLTWASRTSGFSTPPNVRHSPAPAMPSASPQAPASPSQTPPSTSTFPHLLRPQLGSQPQALEQITCGCKGGFGIDAIFSQ